MVDAGVPHLEDHLDLGIERLDLTAGEIVAGLKDNSKTPTGKSRSRLEQALDPAGIVSPIGASLSSSLDLAFEHDREPGARGLPRVISSTCTVIRLRFGLIR